jgi:hypothetical protein
MVKYSNSILLLILLLAFWNCGILGGEDEEKPIVWEEESLEGLVSYGFTAGDTVLHLVNIENNSVTNIYGLEKIRSIASSDNGKYLYVSIGNGRSGGNPRYLTMIDTDDWSSQIIFDQAVELENSGGQIYFITKLNHLGYDYTGNNEELSHTRTFGKIEPETGDLTIIDDIDIYALGIGDDKGFEINEIKQELFGFDAEFRLFRYSFVTGQSELIFQEYDYLDHGVFELSKDGNTLFFANGPVLDINNNKQIGTIISERPSHLVARADKREVNISDPPTYVGPFNIHPKMSVYGLKQDSIIDMIDVGSVNYRMYLSPKERFLITHSRKNIFVVDLKTRELVKKIELSNEVSSFEKFYLFKKPLTRGETNEEILIE